MICPHSTPVFFPKLDQAISDINLSRQSELISKSYQLAARSSIKTSTIQGYQGRLSTMSVYWLQPTPSLYIQAPDEVRAYLYSLYESEAGKNAGDQVRRALVWWSEVYNQPSPCNPSITRLCDSMHRKLPIKGNPARRALTSAEQEKMISLADGKIKTFGDVCLAP